MHLQPRHIRGVVRAVPATPDDGFTLCVSVAVKTAGWHNAHQERRSGESVHWELTLRPNSGPRRALALEDTAPAKVV